LSLSLVLSYVIMNKLRHKMSTSFWSSKFTIVVGVALVKLVSFVDNEELLIDSFEQVNSGVD
jgi:glyceraldehyde-3-phosphate dehydrogenase/erythrose-4-phosphate dehydrogenase